MALKEEFLVKWEKYFGKKELPITFFYTNDNDRATPVKASKEWRCLICDLAQVRKGRSILLKKDTIGCDGAKRYLGFLQEQSPDLEYFLSCGIPGKVEGIRYKKSPEIVRDQSRFLPAYEAPAEYIVFKRWDKLENHDDPLAVIFFTEPDMLSGLFALTNFDEANPHAVMSPSCAGCGSIVQYPVQEFLSEHPRAVLGMFDISARPCVPRTVLTIAIPITKFESMIKNMDESFLITGQWAKLKARHK